MNFRSMHPGAATVILSGLFIIPPASPQNPAAAQTAVASNVIEAIGFRGASRTPPDTLRAMIATRPGEVYSEDAIRRDFASLWKTGRFDDIRVETGKGSRGGVVVTFAMTERP